MLTSEQEQHADNEVEKVDKGCQEKDGSQTKEAG
jgi:hypothetical protein